MLSKDVEGEFTYHNAGPPRGTIHVRLSICSSELTEIESLHDLSRVQIDATHRKALEAGILHALADEADLVGVSVTLLELNVSGGAVNPRMLWDAGYAAATETLSQTEVRRAEPWMRATVACPEFLVGRVSGDLARRRAKILGSESRGVVQVLHIEVPLAEMINYATALRSVTGGRGTFSMRPSRFRIVSREFA